MAERIVVCGAGYAGTTAVKALESTSADIDLTWISDGDAHLLKHEVHRVVRNPDAASDISIPISEIKATETRFVDGRIEDVDVSERAVILDEGDPIYYDYALLALGSSTAFYGIPGLAEHAHTLSGIDDAAAIHSAVTEAAAATQSDDPASIVIGGAGLSGIQVAGEIAALRDEADLSIEVTLLEALEEILPGRDAALRDRVNELLAAKDVETYTDDPITEADADAVYFDDGNPLPYDVLIWTGGITGREVFGDVAIEANHDRLETDGTFRTSDDRVFAVGDTASIDLDGTEVPPTAQAAWDAAEIAARNLLRAADGRPLETWSYTDKGTVLSVGEDAIAHDLPLLPIRTFGSVPARMMKKAIGVRWLLGVTSVRRVVRAWPVL